GGLRSYVSTSRGTPKGDLTDPLFCFEGVPRARRTAGSFCRSPAGRARPSPCDLPPGLEPLENCIASTSIFVLQATKSQRWMPWRLMPKKDVGGCDKPRGAADRASIRGYPNGETHCPVEGQYSRLNT